MRDNHQLVLLEGGAGASEAGVLAEVGAIFEHVLGRPVQINENIDIVQDLGLDSLGVLNFVMAIEDHYDISIPLDRITQVQTVGDLIRAVAEVRSGG